MSYCELLGFTKDGEMIHLEEYRNAHGWAAYIWASLHRKYMGNTLSYLELALKMEKFLKGDQLLDEEKIALWSTSDQALVTVFEIPTLIRAYKAFLQLHHPGDKWVCHLPQMIKDLRQIADNPENISVVGWYGMSVGDNPWSTYNSETEEYEDYNINTGTKHNFLSEFLEECCPGYSTRTKTVFGREKELLVQLEKGVDEKFFHLLKEQGYIKDYVFPEDADGIVMVKIKHPITRINLEETILYDDGLPADEEDLADATRFARVAGERGYTWSVKEAFKNWEEHSLDYAAGWLTMPKTDDDLWKDWEGHLRRKTHVNERQNNED